jgi:S4 domain protein YaaA
LKQILRLKTEYITLGQLLKIQNIISSGGQAKWYLQTNQVWVNGQLEKHRGKKLYPTDQIKIPEIGTVLLQAAETGQKS